MRATKIPFPGFETPAAGFEAPLEMLSACHGRVERQIQTLLRLAARLLGEAHLEAVGRAMRLRRGIKDV